MKIGGEYTFDGPQELVWQTLLDPVTLARVLPGADKLDQVGENEYEAALTMKIGPIQGQFMGKVKLENIQAPTSYTMQVDGRGAPGFVKATGHLTLTAEGSRTRMTYEGDAQVGGRLASVGQRLMETSAKAIIGQSLDGLNAAVKARAAATTAGGAAAGAPPPSVEAPSQAQFARKVAGQVIRDLVPRPVRWILLGLAVVILGGMIYWLAG
jgi:carbon monoxide dehydrogenase subunit G